jgi:hypothetical protein
MRGTAFIRQSSYGTTDDGRSSVFSPSQHESPLRDRNSLYPGAIISRRHSHTSPQPQYVLVSAPASPGPPPLPASAMVNVHLKIEPAMFDALTFKPHCDDPSVVRYSALCGMITAATPPRLVAEITSPTFVDYDLLSDFFLTFRSFVSAAQLLEMLVARLRWALARDDEIGMVVRVRTFVALRHWILNYFMDDFVVDYDLRLFFCELVNGFVDELVQSPPSGTSRLKILGELKKCWRRTCALYWDGLDFATDVGLEHLVTPGGIAGSRDPNLTPAFWDKPPDAGPPQLGSILDYEDSSPAYHNFFAGVEQAGNMDSVLSEGQPTSPTAEGHDAYQDMPLSPQSAFSDEVISCSFPTKSRYAHLAANHNLPGVHPVPASSRYESSPPVAHTPKTVTGKQNRPSHAHKRSGSFSDSLRDERRQPVQRVLYQSTELFMAVPFAGSIVRGTLFPPSQAFVQALTPSSPASSIRAPSHVQRGPANQKDGSGMSGPAMKKLLGSVRRALSKRTGPLFHPHSHGDLTEIAPVGSRGATTNRLPGTAIVPQPPTIGVRAPLRIDILGAGIAADFKRAVREEEEEDAADGGSHLTIGRASGNELMYPPSQYDIGSDMHQRNRQSRVTSGLTNGSKSIVIVDDTLLSDQPFMTGALMPNPSTDTITDAYLQPAAGPTPPRTPPEAAAGSPRRSSHLLGHNVNSDNRPRSLSPRRTPSLVVDMNSPSDRDQTPSRPPFERSGLHSFGRSFKSNRSMSLRKYASYQSGFTRRMTERSFDATTFSGGDFERVVSTHEAPEPPRTLRRRPGGDLRAATNIGDLPALRRPRSEGSLTTYSDSLRSSCLLPAEVMNSNDFSASSPPLAGTFSLGALAEVTPKRGISLFSTHSSQPVMRPSFEAEAAKLAQIPDDVDDDGGVESALLKLEGKYEQRKSDMSAASKPPGLSSSPPQSVTPPEDESIIESPVEHSTEEEKRRHRHKHVVEDGLTQTPPLLDHYQPEVPILERPDSGERAPGVYRLHHRGAVIGESLPQESQESLSLPLSQPEELLNNDFRPNSRDWTNSSILRGPSHERPKVQGSSGGSSRLSFDDCDRPVSKAKLEHASQQPSVEQSFLFESDDEDALSSELSLDFISREDEFEGYTATTIPSLQPMKPKMEVDLPYNPLGDSLSPVHEVDHELPLPSISPHVPEVYQELPRPLTNKNLPPTPELTPTAAEALHKRSWEKKPQSGHLSTSSGPLEVLKSTSEHLPFVLAFDSKLLAEQFTLIEKDALNEIDWKELIDMRWKNSSSNSRSWVDFLRTSDARGVEVVIARFNIMVKWVISECVLTRDLNERAQTIIKCIHIAAHCRRYRNYATMYQLVVALTSADLAKLTKTWAKVPPEDTATLKELETLAQPTKNFLNLRAEMEGTGADRGCIPFVGIYTHDLLFNSQRPSQIASTPTTEPLVNFEKCRTTAAIVKNLLRLLEASSLYHFKPVEGVTERCLWMAALSDEEIRECARGLE